MNEMKVVLSWPDSALMPNRRGGKHWASFQKKKEDARGEGISAATTAIKGRSEAFVDGVNVSVGVVFFEPDRRHRDLDNLLGAIKWHLDGIAKVVGVDDKQFRPITINSAYGGRDGARVEVTLSQKKSLQL